MGTFRETDEADRVRRHTSPQALRRIEERIEESTRFYSTQPPHILTRRIEELEAEWSIERFLDTNASALALTGALLGVARGRHWLVLSCAVTAFLFQHAVTGWCPPVPVLRRLGIRTRGEIDREKFALKALRGDFRNIQPPERRSDAVAVGKALQSVNT